MDQSLVAGFLTHGGVSTDGEFYWSSSAYHDVISGDCKCTYIIISLYSLDASQLRCVL